MRTYIKQISLLGGRGGAQHGDTIHASHPAAWGSNPSVLTIMDVAEVNQQHWLVESGQWLENVDRTHLVLASGKQVLQKNLISLLAVSWIQTHASSI